MGAISRRVPGGPTKPEIAVFVSGVASMGLEILAGRIVAPEFGSSIFTWGSIIGVFLGALSLGYYQGGKHARQASNRQLTWLLLATAGYVALLLVFRESLLSTTASMDLPARYASLPAITVLFGPPTYFLGFISPYAAELCQKDGVGEASGHVYALGTIGSLVGVFGTTFVLIPTLSVDEIGLFFGVLLIGTALLIEIPRPTRNPGVGVVLVSLLLVGAVVAGPVGDSIEGDVVYETQTPYQELVVADSEDTRTMYLDGERHSAMDLDDPTRHVYRYTKYFHMPYLFQDDPDSIDRVLFVGGGGFSGPKRFVEEYNATVDVVEIDPDVIEAAAEYFAVEADEQLNIYNDDGRSFLQETEQTYDAIILDAYKADTVPFELTTREFMDLSESRLSEDGALVANVISAPAGPSSAFYRTQYKTMETAFPEVYAFRTSSSNDIQNIELVATKNETRLSQEQLLERNDERDIGLDLREELEYYIETTETDDVSVLSDDRAPVDRLLDAMVGQQYVIEETDTTGNSSTQTDRIDVAVPVAGD